MRTACRVFTARVRMLTLCSTYVLQCVHAMISYCVNLPLVLLTYVTLQGTALCSVCTVDTYVSSMHGCSITTPTFCTTEYPSGMQCTYCTAHYVAAYVPFCMLQCAVHVERVCYALQAYIRVCVCIGYITHPVYLHVAIHDTTIS